MAEYDLVVIGSGPGGYVAAIRAAQLGLKAAVIEKDKVGGVCLNIGCIPSKALIHQAAVFSGIRELTGMGVAVDTVGFNYAKVFNKSRMAAMRLSKGVEYLLKKNKVDLVTGRAILEGPGRVAVEGGDTLVAKNILLASGSRPKELQGFEFNEDTILSSTGALMLESLPKSMIILGAGAIGVEFAHIFRAFGVEIHLVEALDRILPLEDSEVCSVLDKAFTKRGIKLYTGTMARSCAQGPEGVQVTLADAAGTESVLNAEKLLVAVGRTPNSDHLGLEKIGLVPEKGFIPVGDYYQTPVPGIYAIGDVIDSPLLAHVASKEGEIAVEHMAGHESPVRADFSQIPAAVYCEPEIASFGLVEDRAKEKGVDYEKAMFPFRGCGKAVATEMAEGFVKVLVHKESREILGGHVIGPGATELIHELLLARKAELLPEDIATMVHAHPTLSEAVMESMRAAQGWAIHM